MNIKNKFKEFIRKQIYTEQYDPINLITNANFWMAIHYKEYKAVYFPIPKVANSSFLSLSADILDKHIPNQYKNENWKPYSFRNNEARIFLKENDIIINNKRFMNLKPSTFSFSFVRNPLDRLSSCYNNKLAKEKINDKHFIDGVAIPLARFKSFYAGMPFSEFVEVVNEISDEEADMHFKSQHKFLTNMQGDIVVDYIGKFENLEEEFKKIKSQLKLPNDINLPHLLKSSNNNFMDYYDAKTKAIALKRYEKDIQMFDYKF